MQNVKKLKYNTAILNKNTRSKNSISKLSSFNQNLNILYYEFTGMLSLQVIFLNKLISFIHEFIQCIKIKFEMSKTIL